MFFSKQMLGKRIGQLYKFAVNLSTQPSSTTLRQLDLSPVLGSRKVWILPGLSTQYRIEPFDNRYYGRVQANELVDLCKSALSSAIYQNSRRNRSSLSS